MSVTATRSCLEADLETAMVDIKSQEMPIELSNASGGDGGGKYLSSITSLTIRLPAFDHLEHMGKAYMKIKSKEFVFARSQLVPPASSAEGHQPIIVLPTDDTRLKAIIIPASCLAHQSPAGASETSVVEGTTNSSYFDQVLATLTSMQILDDVEKSEVWMPSFELQVQTSLPELEGLRLSETHRIKQAKINSLIELTHCKAQEEGLV